MEISFQAKTLYTYVYNSRCFLQLVVQKYQLVHLWRSLVSSTSSVARDPPLPACCAQSDEGGDHPRDNLNQTTPEILMKSTARL